jgi:RHS repeat-associated protein
MGRHSRNEEKLTCLRVPENSRHSIQTPARCRRVHYKLTPAHLFSERMNSTWAARSSGKERDSESGLDYFGARYYGSALGRFTSNDEPFADQHPEDAQNWNLRTSRRVRDRPSGKCCRKCVVSDSIMLVGLVPSWRMWIGANCTRSRCLRWAIWQKLGNPETPSYPMTESS